MNGARAVVLLGLLLAGCTQPPLPQDIFYRLHVPEPSAPVTPAPRFGGVAVVRSFEAEGILNERPIAYTAPDSQTLGQYTYRFWTDPPPLIIQRELAEYLRAAGVFGSVVTPGYRVVADYEITGRVTHLDETPGTNGPRAVVDVELGLTRLNGLHLLLLRRYRAEVPAARDSMEATADAMRRALADIFARFTADLVGLTPGPGRATPSPS